MFKRLIIILSALTIILLPNAAIDAQEHLHQSMNEPQDRSAAMEPDTSGYAKSPINKLGRGLMNTATCWAEIPADVFKVSKERDPLLGCTLGLVTGTASMILRGATGIFEAFTFFIGPYDKPVRQPEYAIKNADDKMKEYLW